MAAPTSVAAHMPTTHGGATVDHQRPLTHCMNEEVRDWPALAKKCKHENGRAFPTRDTQPEALKACAALNVLRVHVATKCQVNEKATDGGMPEGADDQRERIIHARMAMVLQAAADDAGTNMPTAGVVWGTPVTTNVDAAAEAGSTNATTLAADTGKQPAAAASAAVTRKRTLADALAEAHQIASTEGVDLHDATAKFAKTSRTQATMDTEQSAGISAGLKAQTELLENTRALNALIRESAGSENVEELRTKPSTAAQIDEQKECRRKGKLNADGFVKVNGHDMGNAEPAEQQTKLMQSSRQSSCTRTTATARCTRSSLAQSPRRGPCAPLVHLLAADESDDEEDSGSLDATSHMSGARMIANVIRRRNETNAEACLRHNETVISCAQRHGMALATLFDEAFRHDITVERRRTNALPDWSCENPRARDLAFAGRVPLSCHVPGCPDPTEHLTNQRSEAMRRKAHHDKCKKGHD